jgi:hypothetical protein
MAYPTYETVPLSEVVADAEMECRIENGTTESVYIKRYIRTCVNAMSTAQDYIEKTATLEISPNFIAELPCDFVKFDRPYPIVFTSNGMVENSGYINYFEVVYTGGPFLTCTPFNPNLANWGWPTVQVQAGNLYFSNNIGATECTISYLAIHLDANGQIVIPKNNKRAIVAGAVFMYKRSLNQPYQDYQREWFLGKRDAKGESNLPDSLEQQRLSYIWNTLNY